MITVQELEKQVWEKDGVRIVIRDRATSKVREFEFKNRANERSSIANFLKNRIHPRVDDREVVVVDGKGNVPNGNRLLKTLRESYN